MLCSMCVREAVLDVSRRLQVRGLARDEAMASAWPSLSGTCSSAAILLTPAASVGQVVWRKRLMVDRRVDCDKRPVRPQ